MIVIDNIMYPSQIMGGISNVFYEITKRLLTDSRFNVKFLDREDSKINYYRRLLKITPQQIIDRFSFPYLVDCFINPKLGLKEKYIFHSSYYRLSRDNCAINVTTVHDFAYEKVFPHNIKYYAHIWQQKYAAMHSDAIICISENTKKDLLYYYKDIDPRKIHVIYNGVSDEYYYIKDASKLDLPFSSGSYCMFVGGRYHYKNFDIAVKCLKNSNYNLVIVGSSLNEKEVRLLDSTLGKARYCLLKNISNARLNEVYNGAHCLLYLSSYEGFGIPCLEAQRAGCPVIGYNSSSIPEVICDDRLLVNNLSVESINYVIETLENIEYRENIVCKGIKFATKFSWDRNYKELSDLYISLLAEK